LQEVHPAVLHVRQLPAEHGEQKVPVKKLPIAQIQLSEFIS